MLQNIQQFVDDPVALTLFQSRQISAQICHALHQLIGHFRKISGDGKCGQAFYILQIGYLGSGKVADAAHQMIDAAEGIFFEHVYRVVFLLKQLPQIAAQALCAGLFAGTHCRADSFGDLVRATPGLRLETGGLLRVDVKYRPALLPFFDRAL